MRVTQVRMNIDRAKLQRLLASSCSAGLNRATLLLQNHIMKSFVKTSNFNPSPAGGPPGTVTGNLRRSIGMMHITDFKYGITTSSRYARIHEYGGTVRPVSSRYLTVPTNPQAARIRARHRSLRDAPGLRFATMFGKKFLIKGPKKRPQIMFVLVRSVTLPARPFLRPAVSNPKVRDNMRKAFAAGFRATFRTGFRSLIGVTK